MLIIFFSIITYVADTRHCTSEVRFLFQKLSPRTAFRNVVWNKHISIYLFAEIVPLTSSYMLNSKIEFDYLIIGLKRQFRLWVKAFL
jgi:hypothetical protein